MLCPALCRIREFYRYTRLRAVFPNLGNYPITAILAISLISPLCSFVSFVVKGF
jgi:hypothetical protein